MEMHYLVSYDICDAKRRRRLLKVLEDYAYRIQFSVFEMCVDEKTLLKIQNWIEYVINKEEDSVLIYKLGTETVKSRYSYGVLPLEDKLYNQKYTIL